jgi:hypothetical protein
MYCCSQYQAESEKQIHLFVYGKVVKITDDRVLIQTYGQEQATSGPIQSFYVWILKNDVVKEKVLIKASKVVKI